MTGLRLVPVANHAIFIGHLAFGLDVIAVQHQAIEIEGEFSLS